jgi:hypothetical protein
VDQEYKWFNLPRLEQSEERLPTRKISNGIEVVNLAYGINLYKNVFTKSQGLDIISRLENTINEDNSFAWNGAQVNDKEDINDLRNCLDLKYRREHLGKFLEFNQNLFDIHKEVEDSLDACLRDYESLWHLQMNYKEAFNFVKYLPGEYFKIHGDHGPYYSCTVSAVVYLNDDYTGGEIDFTRHGIKVKPDAGDIVLFPSNFVYEHASCEVFEGIKYSVVIMTDYNDLHHKDHL